MKKENQRTLYECTHARVKGSRIYCDKGYPLLKKSADGCVGIGRLSSGKQLAFTVCQDCLDFERNGDPIPVSERGWVRKEKK